MDVKMPNLNGFETAALIYEREKLRHIPIIFITAYDNKESRQDARQAGAVAFLSKPFNDELLLETIRATLRDGEPSEKTE